MIPAGAKNPEVNLQKTLIVFERYPGYTWIMNIDGNNLHPLSPTSGGGWMEPKFFPDGSKVIVTHSPTGASAELYSIDVVSGQIIQLTNAPQYPYKWRPFIDATGSKLLVGYGIDPANDPSMLHSHVGIASLGQGMVTDFIALSPVNTAMPSYDPELSPDGRLLTYDAGGKIWMANADGSGARAIADGRMSRFDKFLPGQVLFTHDVSVMDSHTQLWSANYDGSNAHMVADDNIESFCDLPA